MGASPGTRFLPLLAHLFWPRYYLPIPGSLLLLVPTFPVVLVLPPITWSLLPGRKEMRQLQSSRDLARAEQHVLAQQVHELER